MLLASGIIRCPLWKALMFSTAALTVPHAGIVCLCDAMASFFSAGS